MPSAIFFASIGAEVLRIGRATTCKEAFYSSARELISRMFRQGANKQRVERVLLKQFGRHGEAFLNFAPKANDFVTLLLK